MYSSAKFDRPNRTAAALVADKRFKCTECGKCCTGNGEVWANMAECSAIAVHLQVPLEEFLDTYCKPYENSPGWRRLKYKDTPDKVGGAVLLQTGVSCFGVAGTCVTFGCTNSRSVQMCPVQDDKLSHSKQCQALAL